MDTAAMTTPPPTNTTARERSVRRPATVCALAAIGVNLVPWGVGRAAGASFVVDPALGDPNVEVGGLRVVVTTLLPSAVGALLLALAARRSRRWLVGVGSWVWRSPWGRRPVRWTAGTTPRPACCWRDPSLAP